MAGLRKISCKISWTASSLRLPMCAEQSLPVSRRSGLPVTQAAYSGLLKLALASRPGHCHKCTRFAAASGNTTASASLETHCFSLQHSVHHSVIHQTNMSPLDAPLNREQPTNFSLVPQHPLTLQPYSLQSTAAATQWPYPYPTSPTRIPALPALALATDKIVLGYSG